jgi:predicted small secreted protein
MKKKLLIVFGILGIVICAVAIYAYTEYNRKAKPLNEMKAQFSLSADSLLQSFIENEPKATATFLNKVVLVNGTITAIEKNEGKQIVNFELTNGSIRCYLDSLQTPLQPNIIHQKASVKGICTGFTADELGIGADVVMNRCFIEQ